MMRFLILSICILSLAACVNSSHRGYSSYYQGYAYSDYEVGDYGNYYTNPDNYDRASNGSISVPESYHVGQYRSPEPPQSRDRRWAGQQNPNGFTIEISRGAKASQVAKALMRAPKNNRTAALRSSSGVVGVYGSYNSYDEARDALSNLPRDLRQRARIRRWSQVR